MSTDRGVPLVRAERLTKKRRAPQREAAPAAVDVGGLEAELRKNLEGEVRFDDGAKGLYAEDASNYRHIPIGLVIPRSREDVVQTIAACRRFGAPVLSRGGGTSLAGQTCNTAVVLDWSKYMNRILEINPSERFARVEPGVICDEVVRATRRDKLTYAPDPATHDHCTFGGMLGNNSCGVHAQMGGKAVDNTEALEILLYDGTRMHVGWMDDAQTSALIQQGGRVGEIHGKLRSLRDRYAALIRERFPQIPRRVSGYNLDQLLPGKDGRFNIARALVGTESTCVTVLEAKVRLVYNHPERVLLVLGYPSVYEAADHLMEVLEYAPIGLEGLDERLKNHILKKGSPQTEFMPLLPEGKGWLLVEFGYDTRDEAREQAERLMAQLARAPDAPTMKLLVKPEEQRHLWKLRESGLGSTAFVPGEPDTWPGFEDSAVAPEKVGSYLRDLRRLFDSYEYYPSLYGHFGMGCIHCRVPFDLYTRSGVDKFKAFMDEATDLVVRYGGSFSGEHGDGQARAQFLPKMFGPELIGAFGEFKAIWDPDGKMNPGKIVDPRHIDDDLRLGRGDYHPWDPDTHFKYPDDHESFAHATLRCVGIGKCRRKSAEEPDDDTMCPSYMVTHEEMHTTRGRAHLLWEMTRNGGPIEGGWKDEHVKEALDLCLSCKGCKGECPVNVDVATYKAEFLSHYWEGRIRPRSAYAFGLIDKWARLASHVPGLANLVTQLPGLRAVAKLLAGMPQERTIPQFAAEPFTAWFRKRGTKNPSGRPVLLWPDTFNNYFLPETAQAAVEVLEALGHRVEIPQQHLCCGRPLYDQGMLATARRYLERALQQLAPQIALGTPIVVLEPSCCAVFRDELRELFPDREDARRMAKQTVLLSELLAQGDGQYELPRLDARAVVHGHCHHKSVLRFKAESAILTGIGLDFQQLASGCCGMAGSFGYEREKYPISIAAGERVLLPAVRAASSETIILTDGFSCKSQIAQETNRHALHLAEVLKMALDKRSNAALEEYPERRMIAARARAQRRSMARAGLVTAALFVGFTALARALPRRPALRKTWPERALARLLLNMDRWER